MRPVLQTLYLAAAAHAIVFERAACNADNCARAVTGAKANSASRISTDCASFFASTTCPPASTTTVTSGSTSTTIFPSSCGDTTTIAPTNVPAYAQTACPANAAGNPSARFSSACSCAKASRTLSTASVATVTIVMPTAAATGSSCYELRENGQMGEYLTTNDEDFAINCDSKYFYYATDVSDVFPSFQQCIEACSHRRGCVGVQYDKTGAQPTCYYQTAFSNSIGFSSQTGYDVATLDD